MVATNQLVTPFTEYHMKITRIWIRWNPRDTCCWPHLVLLLLRRIVHSPYLPAFRRISPLHMCLNTLVPKQPKQTYRLLAKDSVAWYRVEDYEDSQYQMLNTECLVENLPQPMVAPVDLPTLCTCSKTGSRPFSMSDFAEGEG